MITFCITGIDNSSPSYIGTRSQNRIYFVLTGSLCFAHQSLSEYRLALDALRAGQHDLINKLPEDVKGLYVPLILGLLEMDPGKRVAVEELSQGPYSEVMNVD
ncbi:hypothetical protein MY3296_004189 [Beauveria thailandica]